MRITQLTREFHKIHLNSAKILSLMPHKKNWKKKTTHVIFKNKKNEKRKANYEISFTYYFIYYRINRVKTLLFIIISFYFIHPFYN
jgi:hypothetical protein